jgi:glutathione S-transferase
MKLYITPGSPYARMARVMVLEKGLGERVEIVPAQTRQADSPYYRINPSGRVPYLVRDDGVGLEESTLICDYLDRLDGRPTFAVPAGEQGWEARRLEGLARSLLDGLSVWLRELYRPPDERSPGVIRHETARSGRMIDLWEKEIGHLLMRGALNMQQLTLACALGLEARNPDFKWRPTHPRLAEWFEPIARRESFVATAPPASS